MTKVKVGVVGATGYTGEEIIDRLTGNPGVEVTSLSALVDEPAMFSDLFPRFGGKVSLQCRNLDVDDVAKHSDVVFLALPHTVSMKFVSAFLAKGKKVIDLSADYRLPADVYEKWYNCKHVDADNLAKAVYGLPEMNRHGIKHARLIANPGCYPTSVILSLLPIAGLIAKNSLDVIVDSKSGVTGAGRKALISLSFGEVAGNMRCYKPNAHQHMPEMEHILGQAAEGDIRINFTPHLIPVRRGIMSTVYVKHDNLPEQEEIYEIYRARYGNEPFVRVRPLGDIPEILDVAGTNFCDIGIKVSRGMLVIVSVIDNLLKGASGQAVQNMNIMYGLDEKAGLM